MNLNTSNKHLIDFFVEYRFIILMIFMTGIFAFGVELTNLSLNIDEDFAFYDPEGMLRLFARSSRWAFYIYSVIFPGIDFPFASVFVGILVLSIMVPLWLSRYKCGKISIYVFGALVISSPMLCSQIKFIFQSAYIFISLGVCIISFMIYDRTRLTDPKNALAVLGLAFTLLTYQSVLFLFFILVLIELALHKKPLRYITKNMMIALIISICAVALYFLVNHLLLSLTGWPPSNHFNEHIGWGKRPFLTILQSLTARLEELVSGTNIVYRHLIFLIAPLLALAVSRTKDKLYMLGMLLIALLFSIFVFFMFGHPMPARFFLFFPFLYAAIFFMAFINSSLLIKYGLMAITIYIVLFNTSVNAKLFLNDQFAYERDRNIAFVIEDELLRAFPEYAQQAKKTLIVGRLPANRLLFRLQPNESEAFGKSFFTQTMYGGHPDRMRYFMACLGLDLPPVAQRMRDMKTVPELYEKIKAMPSYPETGFIDIFEGLLIIKLSSTSNSWYGIKE